VFGRFTANRGGRDDPGPAPLCLADEFEQLAEKCCGLGADEDDAQMVRVTVTHTRQVSACRGSRWERAFGSDERANPRGKGAVGDCGEGAGEADHQGVMFANRRPGGELPLAVAAVGAGVGLLSGVGLLPAQGALSTAP
jgi:hypothetical protein